jgi:predicted RNA-binding Zn-ribbon protein involved in translation (DUF1610 family)
VLRFDGRHYTCDFCGYPGANRSLVTTVRNAEQNLKGKIQGFLEGFRKREVNVHYPIAVRPCIACGVNMAYNMLRCPNCGTIQQSTQAPPVAGTVPMEPNPVDRRVFDYIVAHNGTISISKAASDLSLPQDLLQSSIDRLKSSGLLDQA